MSLSLVIAIIRRPRPVGVDSIYRGKCTGMLMIHDQLLNLGDGVWRVASSRGDMGFQAAARPRGTVRGGVGEVALC